MMQKVPAFETEHYELVWEPEEKLIRIALIGDQNEDIVEDYRRAIAILWGIPRFEMVLR